MALAVAPVSAPELQESWAQTYGPQWADVHGFDLTRLRQTVFPSLDAGLAAAVAWCGLRPD
jgi:hypothetical protein